MAGVLAEVAWCSVARGFPYQKGGPSKKDFRAFAVFLGLRLFGKLPCAESLCPWQPF